MKGSEATLSMDCWEDEEAEDRLAGWPTRWMGGWRDDWLKECTNNKGLVELNEF